MKKYFANLIIVLLMLGFVCFQPNSAFAVDKVEISIYYERIDQVIDLNKTDINSINVEDGYYIKYSKTDGYAYKMKRTKVSSEKELLNAMGAKSEKDLKYGQQCVFEAFKAATSDSLKSRAGASYLPSVELDLYDTSYDGTGSSNGYKTGPSGNDAITTPNIRKDFWPCSTSDKKRIAVSDVRFKYMADQNPSGKDSAYTTVFHEYGHFMDQTTMEKGAYGLDKTHYMNEITKPRAAFMEGWAEYNEMIENESIAEMYIKQTKSLCKESTTEAGKYSNIDPNNASYEDLISAESFNAYFLYLLSKEIGQDKITSAFVNSRSNYERDIRDFIKRLISENPDSTKAILKIVDQVFLGKASEEDISGLVSDEEAANKYLDYRKKSRLMKLWEDYLEKFNSSKKSNGSTSGVTVNADNELEKDTSKDIKVEGESSNPFAE